MHHGSAPLHTEGSSYILFLVQLLATVGYPAASHFKLITQETPSIFAAFSNLDDIKRKNHDFNREIP